MSSDSDLDTDLDMDDWADADDDELDLDETLQSLDGRRRVENKLEELRLRRETSEFQFDWF